MRYSRSGRCYFRMFTARATCTVPELRNRPLSCRFDTPARPLCGTHCQAVDDLPARDPAVISIAWPGYGRSAATTVRVADGEPGTECQLDFGFLGLLTDPVSGRQRNAYALIFTACYSRHTFVWLFFTQTLAAFITGCEGRLGVLRRRVPGAPAGQRPGDRGGADAVNPRFTAGWLDYGPAATD